MTMVSIQNGYTKMDILPKLTDEQLADLEAELSNLLGW